MMFLDIRESAYEVFRSLLTAYYRDGEDVATPQSEIDGFISYLYELCRSGKICGCIALEEAPLGFVLWCEDTPEGVFSRKPGFGTILEIGVCPESRGMGIGRLLSKHAESRMNPDKYYVCAYGPAEVFWEKCGYGFRGEMADNGLKIMEKGDGCGR